MTYLLKTPDLKIFEIFCQAFFVKKKSYLRHLFHVFLLKINGSFGPLATRIRVKHSFLPFFFSLPHQSLYPEPEPHQKFKSIMLVCSLKEKLRIQYFFFFFLLLGKDSGSKSGFANVIRIQIKSSSGSRTLPRVACNQFVFLRLASRT
jgi:hypothetical protein